MVTARRLSGCARTSTYRVEEDYYVVLSIAERYLAGIYCKVERNPSCCPS